MSDARALYKEMILDHSKNPRNEGSLDDPTHHARSTNPLCGDRVDVDVRVVEGRIDDIRFRARGCAISRASASLMTEIVRSESPAQARGRRDRLEHLLSRGNDEDDDELAPLLGVRMFPGRAGCATLAWRALVEALFEEEASS